MAGWYVVVVLYPKDVEASVSMADGFTETRRGYAPSWERGVLLLRPNGI